MTPLDAENTTDGASEEAGDADEGATVNGADDSLTSDERAVLDELFAVIEQRRDTLPEDSYTASLFTHEKGENEVLEKIGEETTEVLLAAKDNDNEELAGEAADLVYHLLVLLAMKDMTLADLRKELRERR
ncbi:phosphoribosyl-ATP diphosphatase [Halobacteriales archaeon QS_3_64_16]|nr:MAG: phosphoribosyl-ATP diphosphatase [Halobacteriales archaeon QS_3_64_16]